MVVALGGIEVFGSLLLYNGRMSRALTFICVIAMLGGCAIPGSPVPLDQIDQEAMRLIQQRQQTALGVSTGITLDSQEQTGGKDIAAYRPSTHNPSASDLPAQPQPREDGGNGGAGGGPQIPTVLDSEQDAIRLDLQGILAYAIANSPEYRTRKEALYLSALALIVERHLWGPRFFNTISGTVAGTPEGGDNDIVATLLNQFTVTHRLPYGGSVSVNALVDYVSYLRQSSASSSVPWNSQSTEINASLDLPLLRGAGVVAREDLIQAERDLVYAVRSFERFRREFLVEIANTYFNLILRQQQIYNVEKQLENLQQLADRFEALANAGFEPYFEAERSQAQVLFGRSNLLNSQEAYAGALDAFKIRIGMATTQNMLVEAAEVIVPKPLLEAQTSVLTAWSHRLDLQTSANQVDDAQRQVRIAANELLPDLDFSASIELPTAASDKIAGFDIDPGDGSYSAGFSMGLPLDRRIETSDHRSAQIRLEQAKRAHRVFRDNVALQVRRAIRAIEQAQFNLQLQQRNVRLNERREKGVNLRLLSLGPRDFIEAQEALLDARDRRDAAEAELRRSVLQYLLDTGQMRVAGNGKWLSPGELLPIVKQENDVKANQKK